MTFELHCRNYRRFRNFRWAPEDVCLLVGPNGSGKSIALSAFQFLNRYLWGSLDEAIEQSGGAWGFKNLAADQAEPVAFYVLADEVKWTVKVDPSASRSRVIEETVAWPGRSDDCLISQESGAERFRYGDTEIPIGFGSALGKTVQLEPGAAERFAPLLAALGEFRAYSEPDLRSLRERGSPDGADERLQVSGKNAFTVLRNWKAGTREQRRRYEFVEDGLREAFPWLFRDLALKPVARTVTASFYNAQYAEEFPIDVAPNGFLHALLHLTAVASTPSRGLVAIDEFENGLHPAAIRALIESIRDRADDEDLTVVVTSHSPTVANQFTDEKEQVYVLEAGPEDSERPVRLTDHVSADWLAHFSLGDRYGHDFAAQTP